MAWRKSPPELVALFDAAIPKDSRVERRKMFGFPAAFTNGRLFAGLHQEDFMVRLADAVCDRLCESGEGRPFVAMGRRMRSYVLLSPEVLADRERLGRCIADAIKHTAGLPPKATRQKARKQLVRSFARRPA